MIGAIFLAIGLIFSATIYAGRAMIHGVERNLAGAEMRQVSREVDAELRSVDAVAHDWGSWDDAVGFITGNYPKFAEVNVPDQSLKQLGCDAVLMIDLKGERRLEVYSSKLASDTAAIDKLRNHLVAGCPLLYASNSDPRTGRSGVLGVGDDALLMASRPIVAGNEQGPVFGTVVFIRKLDAAVLKHVGNVSGVTLSAIAPDSPELPASVKQAILGPSQQGAIDIEVRRPIEITAYLRIDSIDGGPALVLYAPIFPADYDMAMRVITSLIGVLLVGGVLWSFVAFEVVDRTSLQRITWLRDSVAHIGRSGALSGRIEISETHRDEAAAVATEVNTMLDALDSSHDRVRESEERHRVLVETMPDAVFTVDQRGTITFANPQAATLTGVPLGDIVGRHYAEVLSADSAAEVAERLAEGSDASAKPLSVAFVDPFGGQLPVELSISPVAGAGGTPVATTWIARDVTERREFEDKLMYLASHDHLTQLYNRRRFEEEVGRRLSETKRRGDSGALIWFDLDRFKQVNDSFGHRAGDELLVRVAEVLRDRSRDEDVLARLGGDEFAMLLPGTNAEEAVQAAERVLQELLNVTLGAGTSPMRVGASAGVALYPQHASEVDELLLRADTAMYSAKEGGRNRVCVFSADEAWPDRILVRRRWAERIESSLADDQFVAHAQPILSLADDRVHSYELLVRMSDADGCVAYPAEFLSIAEDLGRVTEIDRSMVRRAVALLGDPALRATGDRLYVNLSAKTIAERTFPAFVAEQFERTGVDPKQLGFELTETALVSNMARAHTVIGQLRGLGCTFALDDFGSGFSSITYLRHMPIDVLKIDGALVRAMTSSDQDRHIVLAIIDLARSLNVEVTAEYVEDGATLELLRQAGADFAQGFFLGMPKPTAEVFGSAAREGGVA